MTTNEELLSCNDARVWATDFMRTINENNITLSRDFMETWFASAFYAQELQSANGIWNLLDTMVDTTLALSKDYKIENNQWINKKTKEVLINRGQEYFFAELVKAGADSQFTRKTAFSGSKKSWFGFSLETKEFKEFAIGSTVSYGDAGYKPSEPGLLAKYYVEQFQADPSSVAIIDNGIIIKQGKEQCTVLVGKGEWTAKTPRDAFAMALDYAEDLG